MQNNDRRVSVVIPAKNEAASIGAVVGQLAQLPMVRELIVVDDGSTDATAEVAAQAGAEVVRHPYSKGNGAAIKSGARKASGEILVFMDGDGQHRSEDVARLLERLEAGCDMVVGARQRGGQANHHRGLANAFYNRLASWMVGQPVRDLTSGFRAVWRDKFLRFLYLLPNGFSYPTTITMAFFRAGYSVVYEPIDVRQRLPGTASHIRLVKDGVRFLLIIFKIGTLYSPLKLFFPISLGFFFTGLGYYLHTYISAGRFTNMSALLFITSVLVFLIGLVSEQITTLIYRDTDA
ncbi:glycosyltransferase family 2 protein [Azonexus sp.]|uniref:glycosyltransferase family 2 protein n=1 Tax=Azonexus sp. TaxID=1872668 RepID=UPI0035B01EE9